MKSDFDVIPFSLGRWLDLREVPFLQVLSESDSIYIGGGIFRAFLEDKGLDPKKTDIDLFFKSYGGYNELKEFFESRDALFEKIYQCQEDKLSTYRHKETGWKYQCIAVAFYSSLFELVDSFDFTVICVGIGAGEMYLHKTMLEDIKNRQLRWHKITYPAASLRRLSKYARKGYSMGESDYQYFVQCCWERSSDIVNETLVYVD